MQLLDSNILIYSSLNEYDYLRKYITQENYASEISRLEVMGYPNINGEEIIYFQSVFSVLNVVSISSTIIDGAIKIRKQKKVSVGDSIIASTAISLSLELLTRNEDDFHSIEGLNVKNPVIGKD